MNVGKLLVTGLATTALTVPAVAAVRPSVNPVVAPVQGNVVAAEHGVNRLGARLGRSSRFQAETAGGILASIGGGSAAAGAAIAVGAVVTSVVVADAVGITNITGIGEDDEEESPGS